MSVIQFRSIGDGTRWSAVEGALPRRIPRWRLAALGAPNACPLATGGAGLVVGWSSTSGTERQCAVRFETDGSGALASLLPCDSAALGINRRGMVVGWMSSAEGRTLPFALHDRVLHPLALPRGASGVASAVDANGTVVGWIGSPDARGCQAVAWLDGALARLGTLGGGYSRAFALGEDGSVVGEAADAAGRVRAFEIRGGPMRDLGTLGGDEAAALATDGRGQVVGWAHRSDGTVSACSWRDGAARDLGRLGGDFSEARSLNGSGWIVGRSTVDDDGRAHACAWIDGVLLDLNAHVDAGPDWHLTEAIAIDADGRIVGCGTHEGVPRGFLLAPHEV